MKALLDPINKIRNKKKLYTQAALIRTCTYPLISLGKIFIGTSIIVFLLFSYHGLSAENTGIAVLKGQYDNIDVVLNSLNIPFTKIKYRDLENPETFIKYRVIFFPCGIGQTIETSINVLARNRNIHGVTMKKGLKNVDREKISKNLNSFIDKGGFAYFSGYSFKLVQKVYNLFDFFDNFPYMGLSGNINVTLSESLSEFTSSKNINMYVPHSGWIALKSIRDSEILAKAKFDTPRGEKEGPVAAIINRGNGKIIYTSLHNNARENINELMRFIIYRIAYGVQLKETVEQAEYWGQKITGKVIDSIFNFERYRTYNFRLLKGPNTVYFISGKKGFQLDIFDNDNNIITSIDYGKKGFKFDINSEKDTNCTVKIYPPVQGRFKPYSIVFASGESRDPVFFKIMMGCLTILVAIIVWLAKKHLFHERFSGKTRHWNQ